MVVSPTKWAVSVEPSAGGGPLVGDMEGLADGVDGMFCGLGGPVWWAAAGASLGLGALVGAFASSWVGSGEGAAAVGASPTWEETLKVSWVPTFTVTAFPCACITAPSTGVGDGAGDGSAGGACAWGPVCSPTIYMSKGKYLVAAPVVNSRRHPRVLS